MVGLQTSLPGRAFIGSSPDMPISGKAEVKPLPASPGVRDVQVEINCFQKAWLTSGAGPRSKKAFNLARAQGWHT